MRDWLPIQKHSVERCEIGASSEVAASPRLIISVNYLFLKTFLISKSLLQNLENPPNPHPESLEIRLRKPTPYICPSLAIL